jgi:hypothetical protein
LIRDESTEADLGLRRTASRIVVVMNESMSITIVKITEIETDMATPSIERQILFGIAKTIMIIRPHIDVKIRVAVDVNS